MSEPGSQLEVVQVQMGEVVLAQRLGHRHISLVSASPFHWLITHCSHSNYSWVLQGNSVAPGYNFSHKSNTQA